MTQRRNRRGRGRGARQALTAVKRQCSTTLLRYVPPNVPPPRVEAGSWRRMISGGLPLVQDATSAWIGIRDFKIGALFNDEFNTTGFQTVFIHRASFWSGVVIPGTGKTIFPNIRVHYSDVNRVSSSATPRVFPSFEGRAAAYNHRAKVGFHIPAHLSGPWHKENSNYTVFTIECAPDSHDDTFPIQSFAFDLDVTIC